MGTSETQARAPFCNRRLFRITQTASRSGSTFVIRLSAWALPNRPQTRTVGLGRLGPQRSGSHVSSPAAGSGLVKHALPSAPECAKHTKKRLLFEPRASGATSKHPSLTRAPGPSPRAQGTTCPALKFKLPSRLRQKFPERRSAYQAKAAEPRRAASASPRRHISAPESARLMTFPPKTRESQTSRK